MRDDLKIIEAALFTPSGMRYEWGTDGKMLKPVVEWGLPIFLWGDPGTAKTEMARWLAVYYDFVFKKFSFTEEGEAGAGAIPVPREDGYLHNPARQWVQMFEGGQPGLFFIDEIGSVEKHEQRYLLSMFQGKKIGDYSLPPSVRVLAAGNPAEIAASGHDLSMPGANRGGHMDFGGPSTEEWCAYWLSEGGDGALVQGPKTASDIEAEVQKAWPKAWAIARGEVTGFIKRRGELLQQTPKPGDPQASRAWASRRSWEYAMRARASSKIHFTSTSKDDAAMLAERFVGMFVGEGPTSEFGAWIETVDLPDPELVVDGKIKFKHDPERLDRTLAVLTSSTAFITPKQTKRRNERADVVWRIMNDVLKDAPDLTVNSTWALIKAGLHVRKSAKDVLVELSPTLEKAGIRF